MWSFRIFGIPTRVHWIFWLSMAFFGGIGTRGMTPLGYQVVVIFIGAGFVSILGHELGHALTARKYGARPDILLYAFGGLASYPDSGKIRRNQRLEIIAAGPAFGFAVALVVWILQRFILPPNLIGFHLSALLWALWMINFWWSVLNILPIYPLDGGQFLDTWMNGRNPRLRGQIGFGVAAAVAVYGLLNHQIFMTIMFGLLAYQNYQMSEGKRVKFF